MNLSPKENAAVLEMVAERIANEILHGNGADLADLVLLPVAVASKMLALDARTIKAKLPWVDVAPNKVRVRLSDVKAFVDARIKNAERSVA